MKRILIIGTAKQYEASRQSFDDLVAFCREALGVGELDADITIAPLDDLIHVLDGPQVSITIAETGQDIADFDFVWLRGRFVPIMNEISLIGEYLERRGVSFANHSYAHRSAYGKHAQMHLLASLDLPYPKTVFALGEHAAQAFTQNLDFPMIVKSNHGSHGNHNYLVKSETDLHDIMQASPQVAFVAQEYLPNDADFRVLLAGEKQLIIRRQGAADSHLNNTSQGATATLVPEADFPAEVISQARQFAAALHYDITGVDVLFASTTGKHYFLEANSQPQIISGAFVDEKRQLLADYFAKKLAD